MILFHIKTKWVVVLDFFHKPALLQSGAALSVKDSGLYNRKQLKWEHEKTKNQSIFSKLGKSPSYNLLARQRNGKRNQNRFAGYSVFQRRQVCFQMIPPKPAAGNTRAIAFKNQFVIAECC